MKVNREVSDLARKLDYIGIKPEDRRRMIRKCVNPLTKIIFGYQLKKDINRSYESIKKEMDSLEEERIKYQELSEEKKEAYQKLYGKIRYVALRN